MPRIKRKTARARREWTSGHRSQLEHGCDFLGDGWGDVCRIPLEERDAWPGSALETEMREAWEDLRDEIMEEYADAITRPWGWWVFDRGVPIREYGEHNNGRDESEVLEEMGELTEAALEIAHAIST